MPIAAVPNYIGQDFKDASPGLRFGMYLKLWGVNHRTKALLWGTHDIKYEKRGQDKQEREIKDENKVKALSDAKQLSDRDKKVMQALLNRQQAAFANISHAGIQLSAVATAPFTTGLGNEHPLENGFSFLNPYGLPYLAGSGVKGVVRRAAQELAGAIPEITWDDDRGWKGLHEPRYRINVGTERAPRWLQLSVLDVLFGREPPPGDSDAVRGALAFWDVIPQIEGNQLMVEIMTPHQSHYYQQKRERKTGDSVTPHDSGQPTPIHFLTVPPGSSFHFFVTCNTAHLKHLTEHPLDGAPDLLADEGEKPRWQRLLEDAFAHAFEWLGFGAKTAVGYGVMQRDEEAEERARKQAEEARLAAEREAMRAQMTPQRQCVQDFIDWAQDLLRQYPNRKKSPVSGVEFQKAKALVEAAKGEDWSAEDKAAAAQAIEEWGPKLINLEVKELRKRLGLSALKWL